MTQELSFTEYDQFTTSLMMPASKANMPNYGILLLSAEVGELQNYYCKLLRGDYPDDPDFRRELMKELGDVLFSCSIIAQHFGSSLAEVAALNQEKLFARQAAGTIISQRGQR